MAERIYEVGMWIVCLTGFFVIFGAGKIPSRAAVNYKADITAGLPQRQQWPILRHG